MEKLERKYGLWTSIAMVVGVVIGSGIFFKADNVLQLTNGNLVQALLAWTIGAMSMIFGALVFSEFATRIEKANGIVDYSEEAYGRLFAYLVGWFKGVVYYSPLSAILAWVSAMYTMILFGVNEPANSQFTWILAFVYLIFTYILNYAAPKLAGYFQITTTIIKLIPLILIAIIGLIFGLINNVLIDNFTHAKESVIEVKGTFASAVVSTAFAFEGWIVATTINNEIKDAKKNLPKALIIGSLIVFIVYVSYFLGITSVLKTDTIILEGDKAVSLAANTLFGKLAANLLTTFVVVSCLGTLNGLVISCIRTSFSLAIRNQGPSPKLLSRINPRTNMPLYSVLYSSIISILYMIIWYGSINNWFGQFIDIGEIPIILIYGLYIFLYVWYMIEFKDLSYWKRFVIPMLAMIGSLIIIIGGITNQSIGIYLIVSLIIIVIGLVFYRKDYNIIK